MASWKPWCCGWAGLVVLAGLGLAGTQREEVPVTDASEGGGTMLQSVSPAGFAEPFRDGSAERFKRRARLVRLPEEETEQDAVHRAPDPGWRALLFGGSGLALALVTSLALAWRRRRFFETA